MGVMWRSLVFSILPAFVVATDDASTTAPASVGASTAPPGPTTSNWVPAPVASCDDVTGEEECCDVDKTTNAQCDYHLNWAKDHLGGAAKREWYTEFGVTDKTIGSEVPRDAMQCMLWAKALEPGNDDPIPSRVHGCPRPCNGDKKDLAEFKIGDFVCPAVAVKPPTEAAVEEPKPSSSSIPLWAIILISLVAIGAIIAGVMFYLSNDKSPKKKKKKRGLATPAPQQEAPEQEPPAPVVTTAAPIYTTAAPVTYTTAAPLSAGSFVYAPQPVVTTGVPMGSVYQAGPVVTHATPIAASQPIYLQPGGASVM